MLGMKRTASALACALALGLLPGIAGAEEDLPADVPVLSGDVKRGVAVVAAVDPVTPTPKTVDGSIGDWVGDNPRFAGFATYSEGELIYQDYLFDAYGADDGEDYERPLHAEAQTVAGETYRAEALQRKDVPGEFGAPNPAPAEMNHGDYADPAAHDLQELRFAADGSALKVLARTTNMTGAGQTGLLLLIDATPGEARKDVGFNTGLVTDDAEYAALLRGNRGTIVDLTTNQTTQLAGGSVATLADGWTNAIEASLDRDLFGSASQISVVAATGPLNAGADAFASVEGLGTPITNVAFRSSEPVRAWFDRTQAFRLYEHDIDSFGYPIDMAKLQSGATETFRAGPGYHEKVFRSSDAVSTENKIDGIYQHYGVYVPASYDGSEPVPLQWWLHWRGGTAHEGAAVAPRIFKHFGEQQDTVVISPRGRGTGTWYVGEGHVDILEVWADVHGAIANIDPNRVYVSGHSMGGWGSYLLGVLHPDWFAAATPFAGPPTQGLWTGVDFEGCDELQFDEYTPCYGAANGGRPRDQHTSKLLPNLLNIPYGIFHGTDDELVPVSGVTHQASRFVQLGYRHRYYLSPGYEHYTHPAMDEWTEAARYEHQFVRNPNPAEVTFLRDMPFERATEEVQANGAVLDFSFDRAYWMSELTPVDDENGVATFEGRSLALEATPYVAVPDTGPPTAVGQVGPYVITGMQWIADPRSTTPAPSNAFTFTLSGASAVRLDVDRMGLAADQPITGTVTSDGAFELRLASSWTSAPVVLIGGAPAATTYEPVAKILTIAVPAGSNQVITIG